MIRCNATNSPTCNTIKDITIACEDGFIAPTNAIEIHTTAGAIATPTIRTVAAELATRAGFATNSIDALQIAVDDGCALLVHIAAPKATLSCTFSVRPDRIVLACGCRIAHPPR